jgi:hypothetical protein
MNTEKIELKAVDLKNKVVAMFSPDCMTLEQATKVLESEGLPMQGSNAESCLVFVRDIETQIQSRFGCFEFESPTEGAKYYVEFMLAAFKTKAEIELEAWKSAVIGIESILAEGLEEKESHEQ